MVCDTGNKRLRLLSLEGQFLNSFDKGMGYPYSAAVTMNGDLLVCDANKHCIHILHKAVNISKQLQVQ